MSDPSTEPLSAPLRALQAEDSARKAVEGAHSLFHVRPSVAAADALEAALQEWRRVAAPESVRPSPLIRFAERLKNDYALDHTSPAILRQHIIGLAERDAGLGI